MSIEREPAFPFTWQDRHGDVCAHTGMTRLEYFAGLAMQAEIHNDPCQNTGADMVAKTAVNVAKALIAELEKHNG